jgi:beta-lactamase superfamily II metal-dependent hydrolase
MTSIAHRALAVLALVAAPFPRALFPSALFPSALFAAALVSGGLVASPLRAQELEIHVINVGQGSSTFVRGPDGTRVLIDAGEPGLGGVITNYLTSIGVTDLDYTILTSFDADHCGSLDEVMNLGWRPNVAAWDRGDVAPKNTNQENQYKSVAGNLRHLPVVGETIALGPNGSIEVVAVNGQHASGTVPVAGTGQEENSRSLAVVIRFEDFDFYLGGDLTAGNLGTADVEGPVSANVGRVEAMQSSHHGSFTSSTPNVVANLDPSFVAHSAGLDNPYGHPTEDVCKNFNTPSNSRVQWCTSDGDTDNGAGGFVSAAGSFVLASDGETFEVARANGGHALRFACHGHAGTAPGLGDLAITEILVDPAGVSDTFGEWLELANTSGGELDLFGLRVRSGANTFVIDSHLLVADGEHVVVAVDGKRSRNGSVWADVVAPWESFSLANGTGFVEILTAGGTSIERVDWGGANIAIQAGTSDERKNRFTPPTVANFADALTAWASGDLGTPGAVNGNDVPPVVGTSLALGGPAQVGGAIQFQLASPQHAGQVYLLNVAQSPFPGFLYPFGCTPGVPPCVSVPLNLDALFFTYLLYPGWFGNLDFAGNRTIVQALPPNPSLAGIGFFSAFLVLQFDVPTFQWLPLAVSNVLFVQIQP